MKFKNCKEECKGSSWYCEECPDNPKIKNTKKKSSQTELTTEGSQEESASDEV